MLVSKVLNSCNPSSQGSVQQIKPPYPHQTLIAGNLARQVCSECVPISALHSKNCFRAHLICFPFCIVPYCFLQLLHIFFEISSFLCQKGESSTSDYLMDGNEVYFIWIMTPWHFWCYLWTGSAYGFSFGNLFWNFLTNCARKRD